MIVTEHQWRARRDAHHRRVDAVLADHRARTEVGATHPVEDFLFTYYRIRPTVLRRWHPGVGTVLAGDPADLDDQHGYVSSPDGTTLDPVLVFGHRVDGIAWLHRMLQATADRPASFGCFGRHEWAMVYRADHDQVRHPGLPLRVTSRQIAAVVEDGVHCTHFDAFRFFTPAARPLNAVELTPIDRLDHDQPGCLHVGMDLYKWAGKLGPAVCSELVMDCFELARDIRRVDMRASPYDVGSLGLEPIEIETPAGRAAYVGAQRDFSQRARPLRAALLAVTDRLTTELAYELAPVLAAQGSTTAGGPPVLA